MSLIERKATPNYGVFNKAESYAGSLQEEADRQESLRKHRRGKESADPVFNVLIMGHAGVGKSALISMFLHQIFPTKHVKTVEDQHFVECETDGESIKLHILDTSGSLSFPAQRRVNINQAKVFVLVYSVTSLASFKEVSRLREMILDIRGPDTPVVIVGNKIDKNNERQVSKVSSMIVASVTWQHGFVETSALQNENVRRIFEEAIRQVMIKEQNCRRMSLPDIVLKREKIGMKSKNCIVS